MGFYLHQTQFWQRNHQESSILEEKLTWFNFVIVVEMVFPLLYVLYCPRYKCILYYYGYFSREQNCSGRINDVIVNGETDFRNDISLS